MIGRVSSLGGVNGELQRRQSHTDQLYALFLSKPLTWIAWTELGELGGNLAWRTRVSDCRKRIRKAGAGDIEWNKRSHDSRYRYVPWTPLGREAGTVVNQQGLF